MNNFLCIFLKLLESSLDFIQIKSPNTQCNWAVGWAWDDQLCEFLIAVLSSLQKEIQAKRQEIVSEFQHQVQFLKEQEQFHLAKLGDLEREIKKTMHDYANIFDDEIVYINNLIREIEKKGDQPDDQFLEVWSLFRSNSQDAVYLHYVLRWDVVCEWLKSTQHFDILSCPECSLILIGFLCHVFC